MRLDRRGIPKNVLNGKDRKYIKVFNRYRARIAQEFMRLLNESYWERANKNEDSLGNTWHKLRPRTIKIKRSLRYYLRDFKLLRRWYEGITGAEIAPNDPEFLEGVREKGILNPTQRKRFEQTYAQALGASQSQAAKRIAREAAWSAIDSTEPEREFVDLINIRTGRLVASTLPGTVVEGRYYAPPDQEVNITISSINIKLTVPYIDEVESVICPDGTTRPIIPDDILPWVEQAHNLIIQEIADLYADLKSSYERRQAAAKERRDKQAVIRNQTRRNRRTP